MPDTAWSKWQMHHGEPMPDDLNGHIEVRFRDGDYAEADAGQTPEDQWIWAGHGQRWCDIIAYRKWITALDCLGGAILFAALGIFVLTLGIWVQ